MSIKVGQRIKLRPNMRYKDKPELDEDYGIGKDQEGTFLQFQVLDANDCGNGKTRTGFFYVRIHTELPLNVGDMVTVKEIEYVQKKGMLALFCIKIEETSPYSISEDEPIVDGDGSYAF